jgi:hypothetical protein
MPILIARRVKLALGNQLSIKRDVCGADDTIHFDLRLGPGILPLS